MSNDDIINYWNTTVEKCSPKFADIVTEIEKTMDKYSSWDEKADFALLAIAPTGSSSYNVALDANVEIFEQKKNSIFLVRFFKDFLKFYACVVIKDYVSLLPSEDVQNFKNEWQKTIRHFAEILFKYKLADDVVAELCSTPIVVRHSPEHSELTWSALSRLAVIIDKVSSQFTHTRM